jgi:hypothetical protein
MYWANVEKLLFYFIDNIFLALNSILKAEQVKWKK